MARNLVLAGLFSIGLVAAGTHAAANEPQQAQTAPAAAGYTTAATDIGTLLDNPAARAVLDKHVPQLVANEQIAMARSMTLRQIQSFAGDVLTDEVLARIDVDLAKLAKK